MKRTWVMVGAAFVLAGLIGVAVALPPSALVIANNMIGKMESVRTGGFSLRSNVDVSTKISTGAGGKETETPVSGRATVRADGDWTKSGPGASARVNISSPKSRAFSLIARDSNISIRENGTWSTFSRETLSGAHQGLPIISPEALSRLNISDDIRNLTRIDDATIDGQPAFRLRVDFNVQQFADDLVRKGAVGDRRRLRGLARNTHGDAHAILWIEKNTSLLRRIELDANLRNVQARTDRLAVSGQLDLRDFDKGVKIGAPQPSVRGKLRDFPFNLDNLIGAR